MRYLGDYLQDLKNGIKQYSQLITQKYNGAFHLWNFRDNHPMQNLRPIRPK